MGKWIVRPVLVLIVAYSVPGTVFGFPVQFKQDGHGFAPNIDFPASAENEHEDKPSGDHGHPESEAHRRKPRESHTMAGEGGQTFNFYNSSPTFTYNGCCGCSGNGGAPDTCRATTSHNPPTCAQSRQGQTNPDPLDLPNDTVFGTPVPLPNLYLPPHEDNEEKYSGYPPVAGSHGQHDPTSNLVLPLPNNPDNSDNDNKIANSLPEPKTKDEDKPKKHHRRNHTEIHTEEIKEETEITVEHYRKKPDAESTDDKKPHKKVLHEEKEHTESEVTHEEIEHHSPGKHHKEINHSETEHMESEVTHVEEYHNKKQPKKSLEPPAESGEEKGDPPPDLAEPLSYYD